MLFQNTSFPLAFSLFILCMLGSYPLLTQTTPSRIMTNTLDSDPDAFATGVTAFYLNREGNLQTQFETPHMLHYDAQNKTTFENPHFQIYTSGTVPWHIFALHGKAIAGIDAISLWSNVHVHQDPNKIHRELNLKTNAMTLHPKTQTAETDQPVVLTQPGYQVSAIGVHLSLKEEKVNLLSSAKGEFSPHFLEHPSP